MNLSWPGYTNHGLFCGLAAIRKLVDTTSETCVLSDWASDSHADNEAITRWLFKGDMHSFIFAGFAELPGREEGCVEVLRA